LAVSAGSSFFPSLLKGAGKVYLMIAEKSLNVVTEDAGDIRRTSAKKLGLLKSRLEYSDISDLPKDEMHQFLDDFQNQLNDLSAAIFEDFFSIFNMRERGSKGLQ